MQACSGSTCSSSTALVLYDSTLPHISVREYLNKAVDAAFKNTERDHFSRSREHGVSNIDTTAPVTVSGTIPSAPLESIIKLHNKDKYTNMRVKIHPPNYIDDDVTPINTSDGRRFILDERHFRMLEKRSKKFVHP